MRKVIAVVNQKGGVGKTSVCLHTAGVLAETGLRVLLIDMDEQGNLSSVFVDDPNSLEYSINDLLDDEPEVDPDEVIQQTRFENIDILPANITLSNVAERLAGIDDAQFFLLEAIQDVQKSYDTVLIDCPPSLSRATRMAMVAADGVLIPIECQEWAFSGSNKVLRLVNQVRKRVNQDLEVIGFVINKYNPRRALEQDYNKALRQQYGDQIFRTEFRNNVEYTEAATLRMPISFYKPASEQADAFRMFVKELF
ncbi:MAG: ParA family protein [Calditrichaeota bacterium]|nr:ParA family protein [Calditrichota bacterium]MCB0314101.1 ParA family protein [Calditrichota bacterium]